MNKNGKLNLKMAILYIGIMVILISCYSKDKDKTSTMTGVTSGTGGKMYEGSTDDKTDIWGKDEQIDDYLNSLSLEEKIGQMFLCAKCGREEAVSAVSNYHAGGLIMFADDFKYNSAYSADVIKNDVINRIQTYKDNAKVPLLIGVDEEGGTTVRVSKYSYFRSEKFKSPRELYNIGGIECILQDCDEKCTLLDSLGINMNIGPVCDMVTDEKQFMYERSLGENTQITCNYVEKIVEGMGDRNMASVLKHFPGNTNNAKVNSSGCVIDTTNEDEFLDKYFKPFESGINAGANAVLVGHNIVCCFDGEAPASLSYNVHNKLKEDLNFNGVVITDNLDMSEIQIYCNNNAELAVRAVQVGNDMIISTDYEVQINAVLDAVKKGVISEERINESVRKILTWKKSLGLF